MRSGLGQWISEAVATAGLIFVIFQIRSTHRQLLPALVAAFIACAYWFTASTSFANPAVTLARSLTTTFAGIRFIDVPGFVLSQIVGAAAGLFFYRFLHAARMEESA